MEPSFTQKTTIPQVHVLQGIKGAGGITTVTHLTLMDYIFLETISPTRTASTGMHGMGTITP